MLEAAEYLARYLISDVPTDRKPHFIDTDIIRLGRSDIAATHSTFAHSIDRFIRELRSALKRANTYSSLHWYYDFRLLQVHATRYIVSENDLSMYEAVFYPTIEFRDDDGTGNDNPWDIRLSPSPTALASSSRNLKA